MNPATGLSLRRTAGDTDPLVFRLLLGVGDAAPLAVPDSATVALRIAGDPVVSIDGEAKGDGSGTFLFPADDLPDNRTRLSFAITVDDGDYDYTHSRGTIDIADRL